MEDVRTGQPRPTTPEDLHRLSALAHTRGLRLTQESDTVWFCRSVSQHTDPHYVTGLSCDCRGFQEHQRCTHYALLLDHLGWLPEVEPGPRTRLRSLHARTAQAVACSSTAASRNGAPTARAPARSRLSLGYPSPPSARLRRFNIKKPAFSTRGALHS